MAAAGSAVGANHLAAQVLKWVAEALQLDEQTKAMIAAQAVTAFQGWPHMVPQPPGMGHQAEASAASGSAAAVVQLAAEQAAAAVQQATEAAAGSTAPTAAS